jgi:hypothetical protein
MTEENKDLAQKGDDSSDKSNLDGGKKQETLPDEGDKEPKKFDTEAMKHIKELREENKARRLETKALKEQLENNAKMIDQANSRVIKTELRAKAAQMGIIDPDVLDLPTLDKSGVKIDVNGNVVGVDEFLTTVKTQKPHLFQEKKSTGTSSNVTPPAANSKTAESEEHRKKLMSLSPSEAKKAKAEFLKRFRP